MPEQRPFGRHLLRALLLVLPGLLLAACLGLAAAMGVAAVWPVGIARWVVPLFRTLLTRRAIPLILKIGSNHPTT